MKTIVFLSLLFSSFLSVSACSPVNSMQPFDQEQAAQLLNEHRPPNY